MSRDQITLRRLCPFIELCDHRIGLPVLLYHVRDLNTSWVGIGVARCELSLIISHLPWVIGTGGLQLTSI